MLTRGGETWGDAGRGALTAAGAGRDDWRRLHFHEAVTTGAASDSEEMIFDVLDRLAAQAGGARNMYFVSEPPISAVGQGVARRYEARDGRGRSALVVRLPSPVGARGLISHLMTRLLSRAEPGKGDAVSQLLARMRALGVSLLLVEGADALASCRGEERAAVLELFEAIATRGGVPVVGSCASPNQCFAFAEVPFGRLGACLAKTGVAGVFSRLAEVGGDDALAEGNL